MSAKITNAGASLHAKLKNYAKSTGIPMDTALRRYAQERLVHLVSVSPYADVFCLKGGVLMAALSDGHHLRPTEDIDFNNNDPHGDAERIEAIIREVCEAHDGSDGMRIALDTLSVLKERDGIVPGGKVSMFAFIHTARVQIKVDIGFGNVITPHVRKMQIPTILPQVLPPPTISVYPLETVVAEKFHAMARYGIANTRLKDYFDIYRIAAGNAFSGGDLAMAIRNTFNQHADEIPIDPEGLSVDFEHGARRNWNLFRQRAAVVAQIDLAEVVETIRTFLLPVAVAANGGDAPGDWTPDDGWSACLMPGIRRSPAGVFYDDGFVSGSVDVSSDRGVREIVIHEWNSAEPGCGHTGRALQWIRRRFDRIVANGIGSIEDGVGDIATNYWEHMRSKGLADVLILDDGQVLEAGWDAVEPRP